MIDLEPNEVVTILRALFWEEEKLRNVKEDFRRTDELEKVAVVRKRMSNYLRQISFTNKC
jgi:hypothetical protein